MNLADSHPVQRATLIFLKYMLAVSAVLCLASQFRWLDVVWTNTAGYFDFVTNQSGAVFIWQPPQSGMGALNQFRSGDFDDDYAPHHERRLHFLDTLCLPVFSGPGIKGWAIFPPSVKFRFYAMYLNHLYGLLFAAGSYAFARFYGRRRVKAI